MYSTTTATAVIATAAAVAVVVAAAGMDDGLLPDLCMCAAVCKW